MEDPRQCVEEPWLIELQRGLEKLRAGEFDPAEAHFARAHRWAPTRPEVCYALGRERLRRGDAEAAESLLTTAWSCDPTLTSCAAALARCIGLGRGDFAEAHRVLDDATARHPESSSLVVVRAELLVEQGRAGEAKEAARAALSKLEDHDATARRAASCALSRAHNLEGTRFAEHGELSRALFCFKAACDLDPEWSAPLANMGAALAKLGQPGRARSYYERALGLDPECTVAHANLGKLYLEQGNARKARRHLAEAVELSPANASAWVELASACIAAGNRNDAEDCLWQAIDLDPEHIHAHSRLADLLARDGRYLEAARLAERAQMIDAKQAQALLGSDANE